MDAPIAAPTAPAPSRAELRMRRLLRVPVPEAGDIGTANSLFSASIAVSAVRCLITYVALPLLKPVMDLSGGAGPALGLGAGAVSAIAVVAAMRRFWAANHAWRWRYTIAGGAILAFVAVGAVFDLVTLVD